MSRPTPTPTRIRVDPDGVPVALEDVAGDVLTGTLVGAARAGGAVALIVMEHEATHDAPSATVGHMRDLADALLDDPNNPHLVEGTSAWWTEQLAGARQTINGLRARLEHAQLRNEQATSELASERARFDRDLSRLRGTVDEVAAAAQPRPRVFPPAPEPEGQDGYTSWTAHKGQRRWHWRNSPVYLAVTLLGIGLTVYGWRSDLHALTLIGGIVTGVGMACLLIPEAESDPNRGATP